MAKGETTNYETLRSCQNPSKSLGLRPCQAASADDVERAVLMNKQSPQPRTMWTPNTSRVPQTSEESNADNQNSKFPIRHQCSVQAVGESANAAKALHQINMLYYLKSSSTGLPGTTAPLLASFTKPFLYSPKPSKCPHPSITDLTDAQNRKPKTFSKNACVRQHVTAM